MNEEIPKQEERDILMKELASIIHYWAADNSILWQRCSVFLLINSIFFSALAFARTGDTLMPKLILMYGTPILSLGINCAWFLVNARSIAITHQFENQVRAIRAKIPLLSFDPTLSNERLWYEKVEGRKHILPALPLVFIALWTIIVLTLLLSIWGFVLGLIIAFIEVIFYVDKFVGS